MIASKRRRSKGSRLNLAFAYYMVTNHPKDHNLKIMLRKLTHSVKKLNKRNKYMEKIFYSLQIVILITICLN